MLLAFSLPVLGTVSPFMNLARPSLLLLQTLELLPLPPIPSWPYFCCPSASRQRSFSSGRLSTYLVNQGYLEKELFYSFVLICITFSIALNRRFLNYIYLMVS